MAKRPGWITWAVGLGLVLFGPGFVDMARLAWRQRQLDRQLVRLNAQQQALRTEEARLRTDPAYVEGLIRTTFKYAQPGEYVIPLEGDPSTAQSH